MQVIPLTAVEPDAARTWLVEPYVPASEVTLVTGARRAGKGLWCALIAAIASHGRRAAWDLAHGEPLHPMSVLWVTASTSEDGLPELRARFVVAGGDVRSFELVSLGAGEGIDALRAVLARPGAKLAVLDPLQAVLGDLGDRLARPRMEALVCLARATSTTIVAIRHLTKDGATARGRGEIADVARSEVIVGKHPEDNDLVVIAQAPSSYGDGEPVAFRLDHSQDSAPALTHVAGDWDDDIEPIDLLPRPPRRRSTQRRQRLEAERRFLLEILEREPVARPEVIRQARRRRLSERSVERAADELGLRRTRQRNGGTFGESIWELPQAVEGQTAPAPEDPAPPGVSAVPPSANPGPLDGEAPGPRDGEAPGPHAHDGEAPGPRDGEARFRRLELE